MKKIVSLIMAIIMLLSLGNGVFADQIVLNAYSEEYDDIELLKEVILNMNEYEKTLFIEMIQSSIEEQEFYRDNIDRNYIINYNLNDKNSYHDINNSSIPSNNLKMQAQSVSIALKEFNVGIEALELSRTATMLFKSVAASLAAAIADGPLPAGDILLLITGTITVAYLAANWDEIGPKWSRIERLFTRTFSTASRSIRQALSDLKAKVLDKVNSSTNVSVSGRTIRIGKKRYNCNTRAEEAVNDMKKRKDLYYPAVLYRNEVWVAPVDIDRNTALEIIKINSRTAGVFAISDSRARGLCDSLGGAIYHNSHGSGSGYWNHYHARNYRNAHCWFIY